MSTKAVRNIRVGELVQTAVGVRAVLGKKREQRGTVRLTFADGSAIYADGQKLTIVN